MTTVRIFTNEYGIYKAEIEGHSGYADAGDDIVCAAVTSAVRLLEVTLNDVLSLSVPAAADSESVFISLGPADASNEYVRSLFQGFSVLMSTYAAEYPENIIVMEEKRHA